MLVFNWDSDQDRLVLTGKLKASMTSMMRFMDMRLFSVMDGVLKTGLF